MQEVILEAHDHRNAPPTHQRGSKPIDGIWAISGITPMACGYCEFGKGFLGDHRLLWIDIDYVSAFRCFSPPLNRPKARRVSMKNPLSVKKIPKELSQIHYKTQACSKSICTPTKYCVSTISCSHCGVWDTRPPKVRRNPICRQKMQKITYGHGAIFSRI